MARLNTRTSATPLPSRASTDDSLYRDPTPVGGARQSSYSVISPALSQSDKENDGPESPETAPESTIKRRATAGARARRLPTPDSGATSNPNKRQRTSRYTDSSRNDGGELAVYEDEDGQGGDEAEGLLTPSMAEDDEGEGDASEDGEVHLGLQTPDGVDDEDNDPGLRCYNPRQNPEKRRRIRTGYRSLQRDVDDNRDEYVKPGSKGLRDLVPQSTRIFGQVRMTADAVLDSHLLTTISDLGSKQLKASVEQGNQGVGIDVDQFVSRCIFFMKEGRPYGAAEDDEQTRSRGPQNARPDEDDEDGDNDEGLDWAFFGRQACFPSNRRPPLSSFLLGPLSVQGRARTTRARARQERQPLGPATRPEEIRPEDIKRSENSNLMNIVRSIGTKLSEHIQNSSDKVMEELEEGHADEDLYAACKRHRICQTRDEEAAVSLFDFTVNPHSFGQTVENLFYISFLIREGAAKIMTDQHGLPLLIPSESLSIEQQREQHVQKHQAIFSIDYATWQALIEAFDIKEPLIAHRVPEETTITAGGWYG